MINIDIQTDKSIVYGTISDISVSRIGDVVLLEKNLNEDFPCRMPWGRIFSTEKIETIGGNMGDILRLYVKNFDLGTMVKIFDNKKMTLSIFQKNSLCILTGKFCASNINLLEAVFDFEVDKSEMVYNE